MKKMTLFNKKIISDYKSMILFIDSLSTRMLDIPKYND